MIISAPRVATPDGRLSPGWLSVEGDRIVEVANGSPPTSPDLEVSGTLVPGFVDIHCHGGGGGSFTLGDPEQAALAARTHLRHGTTSVIASLVTDTLPALEVSLRSLAHLTAGGVVAGIHLEGPWLSADHCGAHDAALLRTPSPDDVSALIDAGGGHLKMVTLAPELPGALSAIRQLRAAGVEVGIGHTDASYEQARAAIDAGARVATHLFNAERGLHHRRPGPIPALLESPKVSIELVGDGVHVHPAMIGLAWAAAPGRIVLITDAMAAAAAGDGVYSLGPMRVEVREGVARTPVGSIAGSTLTMAAALRYVVSVGVPLESAIDAATRAPAAALGLDDVGVLRPGARADVVVLKEDLEVSRVMRAGAWVPQA